MEVGSTWKGWTVEEYLGRGSFGQVYRIAREEFGYRYESALKVIRIPRDEDEVTMLRNEGMSKREITSYFYGMVQDITKEFALMSELRGNSNIASYEDHSVEQLKDEFGWEICLRMELLTPLYDYLSDHALTAKDVASLGIDISKALEVCEKNDIIHRDIKPDNIFYSSQGTFKLGDFGIARKLGRIDAGLSKKGTFTYMAPEVYKGEKYDSTADIYSLGLVMYRFMNGNRSPFQDAGDSIYLYQEREEATMRRMSGEKLPQPANADDALSHVILKACAYDPKDRYQNAADLHSDLAALIDSQNDEEPVMQAIGMNDETLSMFSSESVQSQMHQAHDNDQNHQAQENQGFDAQTEQNQNVKDLKTGDDINNSVNHENKAKKGTKKRFPVAFVVTVAIIFFLFTALFSFVPDVKGLSEEDARKKMEGAGFKYGVADRVFSDSVERGTVIKLRGYRANDFNMRGVTVYVIVSRGKAIKAPNVTGMTKAEAEKKLKNLRLVVMDKEYSDKVEKGLVIRQDPKPKSKLEQDDPVAVVISRGKKQVKVPDVAGKTQGEAAKTLENEGFVVATAQAYSSTVATGSVISQDKQAGTSIEKGSTVTITVSLGQARSYTSGGSTGSGSGSSSSSSKKSSKKSSSSGSKHGKGVKL